MRKPGLCDYIMSGQVVTVDDKQAVVCVSDTDGLKEHQVFNVYRTVYDPTAISEGENSYSREFVGKIRLGKTKDKHFAEAIVLDGEITRYDMVEFDRGLINILVGYAVVNNRVYHQPYRIAVIVTLVLVSVLFTTACSAVHKVLSQTKKQFIRN